MKTFNLLVFLFLFSHQLYPCSTFMLKNDCVHIIGQNLDMPYSIPGYFTKNNRGIQKESRTWDEISSNTSNTSPRIKWVSKYGSITFSPFSREFPEGGINEAGLYIREMSLAGTRYPINDSLPKMFMMQWMQYQLDNYSTVDQVLTHLSEIIIDGWGWHYFIADSSGNTASIEFLEGKAVIHKNDSMPYKITCNSIYSSELINIQEYASFGGTKPIDINNKSINRFVRGADMINQFAAISMDPVSYGFQILDKGLGNSGTQWSIIIDVTNSFIYFKSSVGKEIKFFDFSDFKFQADSDVKILDLNLDEKGNVQNYFEKYTRERSVEIVEDGIRKVFSGLTPNIVKNIHDFVETTYIFQR